MKLRGRITMEAEITEYEAAILVETAKTDADAPDILKRMTEVILKKAFPNAGYDSYIPGNWLEEEITKPLGLTNSRCEDLKIPEGEDNNGRI